MDSIQEFATYLKELKKDELLESIKQAYRTVDSDSHLSSLKKETGANHLLAIQCMKALFAGIEPETNVPDPERFIKWLTDDKEVAWHGMSDFETVYLFRILKKVMLHFVALFTTNVALIVELVDKIDGLLAHLQLVLLGKERQEHLDINFDSPAEDQQYKDFFDHAHDLAHVVLHDGTILYVNNAWQKVLEYNVEEIHNRSIYDFVSPRYIEDFRTYRQQVLHGLSYEKEITLGMLTRNGRLVMLEGFITAKTAPGKPAVTRGIFRDITEKLENENKLMLSNAALKEREENLQRLVNYAPDAIIAIDAESFITYWNPKATKIFGWTSEEVIGKQLSEVIIPPVHREAHAAGMQRYLSTGIAHVLNKSVEISALNKQGNEFYISLTISNFRHEGAVGFISFIRDITGQKQNELELEQKRIELEVSNKELERYAWLTSHDLREPLRKILTFSDIVLTQYAEQLPEKVVSYAKKIHDSGLRMGSLINALLSYSRLSHEHLPFEKADLDPIIQHVLADLELLIEETKATFEIGELPSIEAIPLQMYQLLQNLISNSLRYANAGVRPFVKVQGQLKDSWAEVTVRDNGKGFLIRDENQVFRLFERIHPDGEGMGIGLALCKKIVDTHHGRITVESKPGLGTTFTINLPVKQIRKENNPG